MSPLLLMGAMAWPAARAKVQKVALAWGDRLQAATGSGLVKTYSAADLTPFEQFPVNSYLTEDPGVDLVDWRLQVEGAVSRPGPYPMAQIQALPKFTQITRHVCIEGWSAVGSFAGARLADFLQLVGAAPDARFIEVECADDYYESIDLACALHPQTLLCYEMYGRALTPGHGAPLRLQMPTKLGYKQAKHLVTLRVSRVLGAKRGYWVEQGYPWFGGI